LAYDHSRVKLVRPASDGVDSDYINANYVPGYDRRRKAYIAAQSPFNERTICDFWLMVYQQRVTKVTGRPNAVRWRRSTPTSLTARLKKGKQNH